MLERSGGGTGDSGLGGRKGDTRIRGRLYQRSKNNNNGKGDIEEVMGNAWNGERQEVQIGESRLTSFSS